MRTVAAAVCRLEPEGGSQNSGGYIVVTPDKDVDYDTSKETMERVLDGLAAVNKR